MKTFTFTVSTCLAAFALSGCATDSAAAEEAAALETPAAVEQALRSSDAHGARWEEARACVTTYATCVRGGGTSCQEGLRACAPRPEGRPAGVGGRPGGGGRPPWARDGGRPGGAGGRPDGVGGRPEGAGGPPTACIEALTGCATGSGPLEACVEGFRGCMTERMADRAAALCSRAATLCAGDAAPPPCAQIATRCAAAE